MEEERSFRAYITESVRLNGDGKVFSISWEDTLKKAPVDSRTADEIAADVIKNAGLRLKGGEEDGFTESGSQTDVGQQ